jgi:hypothetical protein
MSTLEDFERSMETNMEIKKRVDEMFKRVYSIKKIRRKKKLKEWLGRHLN